VNKKILGIVGGVVGLALIFLLAFSIAGETPVDASIGYGQVDVTGDPLPVFNAEAVDDVGTGLTAPSVVGADWNDVEVTIEPDGGSKIVVFLAHWCSHCQAEVPLIQQWIDDGNLPDDVEMIGVATSTDQLRPNWPPQDWLTKEGWTVPTMLDNQLGTVAVNYGMSGTPFYVVLDGENTVIRRVSGEIGVAGLNQLVLEAQAGAALSG
jgi:thiol-disulfide isomerase/thioredoxin